MLEIQSTEVSLSSTEEHRFSWKIDNLALIRNSTADLELQKLTFEAGTLVGIPSTLCFSLGHRLRVGYSRYSNEFGTNVTFKDISMHVNLTEKPKEVDEVNISFQVWIKNKNGEGFYFQSKLITPFDVTKPNEESVITVLRENELSSQLPLEDDGALVIEIQIQLYSAKKKLGLPNQLENFRSIFIKKLQLDMSKMLWESCPKADSPTKIISKDGFEYPVNRGILSARSPVFMRMFETKMQEVKTGIVNVKDISSPVMKIILHFVYTGMLHETWSSVDIVEELMYAAGKYELYDLMQFLDAAVGDICTEENAGKLMNLAKKLDMKKAEKNLFLFIKSHAKTFEQLENFMVDAMALTKND